MPRYAAHQFGLLLPQLKMQRSNYSFFGDGIENFFQFMLNPIGLEYINVVKGGGERSKGFYRIKSDEEIRKVDYSMIPTPLEMKELLKNHKLS